MTNEEQKLREIVERWMGKKHPITMQSYVSDLTALISEGYVSREEHNKVVQQRDELLKALSILLHLHYCEQEGIGAGQPTPEQWFKAVEYAEGVVQKAEAAIKNTDTK